MADRPIIFSAPMIQALLAGRKSQTRRLYKPMNGWVKQDCREVRLHEGQWCHFLKGAESPLERLRLPYAVGDQLWVRESLAFDHYEIADTYAPMGFVGEQNGVYYGTAGGERIYFHTWAADGDKFKDCPDQPIDAKPLPKRGVPSIHMPRWASRLTLVVTDVRVQRLQDISEADALAEGATDEGPCDHHRATCDEIGCCGPRHKGGFHLLWNSIHGADAWAANPWVTAISFEVHHCNIDALPAVPAQEGVGI